MEPHLCYQPAPKDQMCYARHVSNHSSDRYHQIQVRSSPWFTMLMAGVWQFLLLRKTMACWSVPHIEGLHHLWHVISTATLSPSIYQQCMQTTTDSASTLKISQSHKERLGRFSSLNVKSPRSNPSRTTRALITALDNYFHRLESAQSRLFLELEGIHSISEPLLWCD